MVLTSARRPGTRFLGLLLAAGCGAAPQDSFQPCPIQEPACQMQVFLTVEQRRGQLWDPWSAPPPVDVISTERLRELLLRLSDQQRLAQTWAGWTGPLHELGLLGTGLDVTAADQTWWLGQAASYWANVKRVMVIDRMQALNTPAATATLAHEYVHAAQDREFGLGYKGRTTTDQELVRTALVEGEAELYGTLSALEMAGDDPSSFDWQGYFGGWLSHVRGETSTVPSPHTLVRLSLPYPLGGAAMARAWSRRGAAAVNQIFLHPPPSFLTFMLGGDERPPLEAPCALMVSWKSFRPFDGDTLGAAVFYAYLVRTFGAEDEAWQSALLWRGDRIWVVENVVTGALVTLWRVHAPGLGDSPLGAPLAARRAPPVLEGDDLLYWSGDPTDVDLLRRSIVCSPGAAKFAITP